MNLQFSDLLNLFGAAGGSASKLAKGQTSTSDLLQGAAQGAAVTAAPMAAYAMPALAPAMTSMAGPAMASMQPDVTTITPSYAPQAAPMTSDPWEMFQYLMRQSKGGRA